MRALRQLILMELRQGVLRWYKEKLPGWPQYIIKDMFYSRIGGDDRTAAGAVDWKIQTLAHRYGFTRPQDMRWKLESLDVMLDIFEPNTRGVLEARMGKHGEEQRQQHSGGIPRDAERHQTQASLTSKRNAPSPEPITAVRLPDGMIELLEGWHRTIQSLTKWPDGYKQRAYILNALEHPNDPGASSSEPEGGWEWL
jgi:hypothetical protein